MQQYNYYSMYSVLVNSVCVVTTYYIVEHYSRP